MAAKWKALHCSSSLANWEEKLLKRTGLKRRRWFEIWTPCLFFGLYHPLDYLRFLTHFGPKKVFWTGSDILALSPYWAEQIRNQHAKHFCENNIERGVLEKLGITSEVRPMIFDDPEKYQVCYKHSENPRVFGTYHKGREEEYGVFAHPQIDWLCDLPEAEFNEKIKEYQGCVRLNKFDGFAESLAKSVLLGQYQWSFIPYPYITINQSLDEWLDSLKYKREPNPAEKIWRQRLNESLNAILN